MKKKIFVRCGICIILIITMLLNTSVTTMGNNVSAEPELYQHEIKISAVIYGETELRVDYEKNQLYWYHISGLEPGYVPSRGEDEAYYQPVIINGKEWDIAWSDTSLPGYEKISEPYDLNLIDIELRNFWGEEEDEWSLPYYSFGVDFPKEENRHGEFGHPDEEDWGETNFYLSEEQREQILISSNNDRWSPYIDGMIGGKIYFPEYLPPGPYPPFEDDGVHDFKIVIDENPHFATLSVGLAGDPVPSGSKLQIRLNELDDWVFASHEVSHSGLHGRYIFHRMLPIDVPFILELVSKSGELLGSMEGLSFRGHMFKDVIFDEYESYVPQIYAVATLPNGDKIDPSEYSARWYDSEGIFIKNADSLDISEGGSKVSCEFVFEEQSELASVYQVPQPITVEIENTDSDMEAIFSLEEYTPVTLKGTVKELASENILPGAELLIRQHSSDRVFETSGVTDSDGKFTVSVKKELETEILLKVTGYFDGEFAFDSTSVASEQADMGTLFLRPINSTYLAVDAKIQSSVLPGDTPEETKPIWSNIIFELFNETQNKNIEDLIIQNGRIYILDKSLQQGDSLILLSSLLTNEAEKAINRFDYNPSETPAINVMFLENGGFTAEKETSNRSAAAVVFDADEKYVNTFLFADTAVESLPLRDGAYKVVFMDKTLWLSYPGELSVLSLAGLEERTDYILKEIEIKAGEIKSLGKIDIPAINIDDYIFSEKSGMTTDRYYSLIGDTFNVRSEIAFDEKYHSQISDITARFELPDGCEFIEDSVAVDGISSPYSFSDRILEVPLSRAKALVHFSVSPTQTGNFNIQGFTDFTYDGEQKQYPLGNVIGNAGQITLNVPLKTGKILNIASGTASPDSSVQLYDNGVLVGTTYASAAGNWSLPFNLSQPSTFSSHEIYAEASKGNVKVRTQTQSLYYNQTMDNGPTKITMHHYLGVKELELNIVNNGYYFFDRGMITFVVDFPSPQSVENVQVISRNNRYENISVPLAFDGTKWVGSKDYGFYDAPVWLGIDYEVKETFLFTSEFLEEDEEVLEAEDISDIELPFEEKPIDFWLNASDEEYQAHISEIEKAIEEGKDPDYSEVLGDFDYSVDGNKITGTHNGLPFENIQSDCAGMTEESLAEDGFEKIEAADESLLYVKSSDNEIQIADLANDQFQKFSFSPSPQSAEQPLPALQDNLKASGDGSYLETIFWATASKMSDYLTYIDVIEAYATVQLKTAKKYAREKEAVGRYFSKQVSDLLKEAAKNGMTPSLQRRIEDAAQMEGKYLDACKYIKEKSVNTMRKLKNLAGKLGKLSIALKALFEINDIIEYKALRNRIENCPRDDLRPFFIDRMDDIFYNYVDYFALLGVDFLAGKIILFVIASAIPVVGWALIGVLVGKTIYTAQKLSTMKDNIKSKLSKIASDFDKLKCDEPQLLPYPQVSIGVRLNPILDPSGYVYEAVADNRLQGVTATAYYKENLEDTVPILWDAEEYDQINPLITDKEGRYAWNVPIGWWQVKYEKEGYETAYSEWLPVPPPQLEVNIGMRSLSAPDIDFVNAYSDYIEVVFDKYMDIGSLENNISVSKGADLTDVILKPQTAAAPDGTLYAKAVRIYPKEGSFADTITLNIKGEVKSYSGITMVNPFGAQYNIVSRANSLKAYDVSLPYNESKTIYVHVNPAGTVTGREIKATSNIPTLVQVQQTAVVNEFGVAAFTVKGLLPGEAEILFELEDSLLSTSIHVDVAAPNSSFVPSVTTPPVSSIASGKVDKGTAITLSCEMENADIYYSVGKSASYENCILYDGTDVVINEDTAVFAYAVANGYEPSEISVFNYSVNTDKDSLEILTDTLPDAYVGKSYSAALAATENNAVWSITGGTLPEGLSLSKEGIITGTPIKAETVTFTVTAADNSGKTDSKAFALNVLSQKTGDENTSSNPDNTSKTQNPRTGESSPYILVIIMGISFCMLLVLLRKNKFICNCNT
ncbi:MAG TPA: hypothetical protein DEQ02_02320 [Ruminococcaceae bacterium]|nr:hypothetical protein [Oscillospiraceae bacterium]